ncbi:MAG: SpoIIE family protein phosphatase [Pyrinomonadaceae bacterium]|nr:SpoIIE family protein phosphatase [Pyrinomonadaceae bacterium]
MDTATVPVLREQLLERREKLQIARADVDENAELLRLLGEVDAALGRMDDGTYGLCDVCHDPIESDRLLADPLVRFCLGDLTPAQQTALQDDLDLAAHIQRGLLPESHFRVDGWEACFHYEAVGPVSGDYCDLIKGEDGSLYFVFGDVSGKGVAASMLMAHLHAMFHTLVSVGMPLKTMVERASRVFCESTLPTHFATLVCGRADTSGEVEICNAGHLPPLLIQKGDVKRIESNGLPVGIFCDETFSASKLHLEHGDTLFLYTDGLSETLDGDGAEYGMERLTNLVSQSHTHPPQGMVKACLADLSAFRAGTPKPDDLTMMAIRWNGHGHA